MANQQCSSANCLASEYIKSFKLFLRKCIKPSAKEFIISAKSHGIGIGLLGILGYGIKLIHIPINNIIVSKPIKE
ncbi:ecE/Sec61-gamma subunit of protein translocation complex [Ordospora colligata]|uniref:SecE/Sec61-gamma subunit of protein translocation complex n=1 Tax=Ordospora colligata OC4 TaxID=1354746 RepID=A0A0B2UMJ0_9MICR|nr:SecE/Sec61-gamma subunit of protein translocation complex [Ordospora colligata OC4]KHN70509.1 SecE/Sec61-gamma subunit of protein translocation complex [Ordospora colligata OC4]TBU17259.1 SecE/Sec61-gamma subunit of protein translocation complex [Ordospora colligata]TBU17509.1 SecE/Sec61-gamma subunit of protein translocation complex [Ordospora colligata]TBU19689.1 ecE/Sec61-gamma subunit of protein translocation complex [Ordospora colligata]